MTTLSGVDRQTEKTTLSESQQKVADSIKTRIESGFQSVTLGGLAGTGKTTLVGQLPEILGVRPEAVAFCAYTGKAATVINRKYPLAKATTIHKLMYRAIENHDKDCPRRQLSAIAPKDSAAAEAAAASAPPCAALEGCGLSYQAKPALLGDPSLVIVDEASMVPENIYSQLLSYGVPVIWVGDHGQLGPVKSSFNLMQNPDLRLEEIHRQAKGSAILMAAMKVRNTNGERIKVGRYAHGELTVRLGPKIPGFDEHEWQQGELTYLVATNVLRQALNNNVRRQLGLSGAPQAGDRVVCLRNNDSSGIFNGMTGTVQGFVADEKEPSYGRLSVALDYEDRVYVGRVSVEQFGNPTTLQSEVDRKDADLWDYGYALTVHKSQGSEYERVVVLPWNMGWVKEPGRWMYTAITRAKKKLEIVYAN